MDITRIEELVERIGGETNQEVAEHWIREQASQEPIQETACPTCGGKTHYKGRYDQSVLTAQGHVRVSRAHYHCGACATGHCPLDRLWGLGPALTTPTVQARTATLGVWIPSTRLPTMVQQLGVAWTLDVKSAEDVTQRVGARSAGTRRLPRG